MTGFSLAQRGFILIWLQFMKCVFWGFPFSSQEYTAEFTALLVVLSNPVSAYKGALILPFPVARDSKQSWPALNSCCQRKSQAYLSGVCR